jgi:nanoRNase/pAp phosphatase (c-di-AMP/oligoRNAs hydrolase)
MLGCGPIGYNLLEREPHFLVVDPSGEALKKGYNSIKGDPGDKEVLITAGVAQATIIVILENSSALVPLVRSLNEDAFVVARKDSQEPLEGADAIIPSSMSMAEDCLRHMKAYEKYEKKEALESVLKSGKTMAIIMHDNPDPDCISSALSLQLIAQKTGVHSDLYHGGQIGYSENRILVEILDLTLINPRSGKKSDFTSYDITAFVDHSPWDYTSIARDVTPDIVIDHHIPAPFHARFTDVREDAGSTSTILLEYLQLFDIDISSKLATALFYGLLVDTNNLRRGISEADIEALRILRNKIDPELLSRIERVGFMKGMRKSHEDTDFLEVLAEAVKNMEVVETVAFSYVGTVKYRDAVSRAADFLLKMEHIDVVLVYGIVGEVLYVSARSWDGQLHIGQLMKSAFKGMGKAGGHPLIGGATIPLKNLPENFEKEIKKRVLHALSSYS